MLRTPLHGIEYFAQAEIFLKMIWLAILFNPIPSL